MSTHLKSLMFPLVMIAVLFAPFVSFAEVCGGGTIGGSTGGGIYAGGTLGVGSGACGAFGGLSLWGPTPFGLPGGSIFGIVATVVDWLLALFGILGILGFIISGIMYLLSAGDEKTADKAKAGLKYSIIGIVVGLSGFVIMQAINGLLSGMAGAY
ncbi:MAG: hypothetical protein PHT88_03300 [Candidatus Moranbacteria bacterium]|nr:hypothetical protein [Candidatus Moranbacteria bacterium]